MTDLGEKCRRGPENHANNTNMRDGGMQSDFACDLSFFRIRVSVGPAGSSIGEGPRRAGPKYGRGRMTRGCHFAGHTGLSYSPSLRPVFIQSFMNRCSSTWNTPCAVIRNSGITGKARKESVPNGASRGHPIACAAWLTSSNWRQTVSASWSESRPATGRGSMAPDGAARRGDESTSVLGQRPDAGEHVPGVRAGNDQVVGIVRDGRPEGAVTASTRIR